MNGLTLGELDQDGALLDAFEQAGGDSRADFLRKALVGSAALIAGLTLPEQALATSKNDVEILNYALTLEYLQAAFYTETERMKAVRGKAMQAARLVGAVERAHVRAFRTALGCAAVKRPTFDFRGVTEAQTPFLKTAVAFEDLAVAAYKAQAPLIQSKAVLGVAVSIHSIEARHAAWMRFLFGIVPAQPRSIYPSRARRFCAPCSPPDSSLPNPKTSGKEKPRYTG